MPPNRFIKYHFTEGGLVSEERALAPPAATEVVVEVVGVALSANPDSEIVGRVVATGEAAAEWIDRRVLVPRLLPCGECARCRRGSLVSCAVRRPRAGLASHERVPVRFLCALSPPLCSEGADLALYAGLADTLSKPYAALARIGVQPNERWIITGAGPSGLAAISFLRARGAKVAVVEAHPRRRQRAERVGAEVLPLGEPLGAAMDAWAIAEGADGPVFRLLDTGVEPGLRERALALLSPGAIALFLEGEAEPLPLDWQALVTRELTLIGAGSGHPDLLPELCALVARGELGLAELVEPVGLAEANAARSAYLRGESERLPILRF